MRKTFFALLMAVFVLMAAFGTANAAWSTKVTTTTTILPLAASATLAAVSADAGYCYTLGTGQQLVTNDTVTLTLTNGATWAAAPTMVRAFAQAGSWGTLNQVGDPTGQSVANFKIEGIFIVTEGLNLTAATKYYNVQGVTATADLIIGATQTSAGGLTIINNDSLYTASTKYLFTKGTSNFTTAYTAQSCVADVSATTGAYTLFTGAATTNTACTGGAALALSVTTLADTNIAPVGKALAANSVLYTLAGDFTGVTSVTGVGITPSDSAGTGTGGTALTFGINAGKTAAYATNTAAITANAPAAVDTVPLFTINGTSSQTARVFTAAINKLAEANVWSAGAVLSPTTLFSITRNGSFFVSNSIGSINSIKITDRSAALPTAGGAIIVTAWDAGGTALTEVSGAPSLTILNNGTTTISGTDLAARFTGTAMKYEFAVESSNIVATSVKTNSDGSKSSTVYQSSGSGGAL